MKRTGYVITLLICLLLAGKKEVGAAIGDWKTITNKATIEDIAADGDSLILATNGGVLVFDRGAEQFVASFTNTEGLSNNHPVRVAVDANHNWWLGMQNGDLNFFDRQLEKWMLYSDFSRFEIHDMLREGDSLFVSLNIGVSLFLLDKGEAKETYQNLGSFPVAIDAWSAYVIGSEIWVATDYGLAIADLRQINLKAPQSWRNITRDDGLISNKINKIVLFDNKVFIGSDSGVQIYENGSWGARIAELPARRVVAFSGAGNSLFVAFAHQIYRYDATTGQWSYEKYIPPVVNCAFSDRDGELWIGTEKSGLLKWDVQERTLTEFVPEGPNGNNFADLAVDQNGDLWCASGSLFGNGVYHFNGHQWENYSQKDGNLPFDNTVAVAVDRENRVWVGTWGGGVFRFEEGRVRVFSAKNGYLAGVPENVNYVVVRDIAVDQEGTVWLLNYQAYNGRKLVAVTPDSQWVYFSTTDGILSANPVCIAVDQFNRKWIGTEGGGIYVYDDNRTPADKSDDQVVLYLNQADGLENNNITALAVDDFNTVWIGTTEGMNFYQNGRVLTIYGLITNDINCITVDPVGNKWVGTSAGVSILEDDIRWRHYTTENSPLVSSNVLSIAIRPETGTAYIGTSNGLSVFETAFVQPAPALNELHVYPNPLILGENSGQSVELIIDGLTRDTAVNVYSSSGFLVRELVSASKGGRAVWDGRDGSGEWVPNGVYIVVAVQPDGKAVGAKVAVIRE